MEHERLSPYQVFDSLQVHFDVSSLRLHVQFDALNRCVVSHMPFFSGPRQRSDSMYLCNLKHRLRGCTARMFSNCQERWILQ